MLSEKEIKEILDRKINVRDNFKKKWLPDVKKHGDLAVVYSKTVHDYNIEIKTLKLVLEIKE